jgi:hypothetical protein
MSGNDPTEGLALIAEIFFKTVKTVKKLAKIPLSLDAATWHLLQPHSLNNSVWRFGAINSKCCGGVQIPS